MTDNNYVVVYMTGDDVYTEQFEDYEEALKFVEESDIEASIVKISVQNTVNL